MAKHEVTFTTPESPLGNADLEFAVKRDGKKIGTLKVSKGSVVWVPKNNTYGYRVAWTKLDELFQAYGDREARTAIRKVG